MGQYISRLVDRLNGQPNDSTDYDHTKMGRHMLVTGGATVPFKELLLEVATPQFIATIKAHGFTSLDLQCGTYVDEMQNKFKELSNYDKSGLDISIFDFDDDLKAQMQILCRGEAGVEPAGVVIGHAGTGTISDTLEAEVAMIAVANPNLMDNHQCEFAAEMAAQHANIIRGHLGKLAEAIPQIMDVIEKNGLDHLAPLEDCALPVGEGHGLNFLDQVIAGGF